jgi:hypothetical protein
MNKKILILSLILSFLGANTFAPPAFAEGESVITKIKEWIKPVKLDDETRNWLISPGLKSVIYTEMNSTKYLTIESDGEVLRFHSCGCGMVPPNCPLLLPEYYTFTPDELLIHTTSFKGTIRVGTEILFGAVFLAAGSMPGLSGEAASILGGLAFIGAAINPQAKFTQAVAQDKMASGIVKTVEKELHAGQNPVTVMETGGTFESIAQNFQGFLISVKNHGTALEKKELVAKKQSYHLDTSRPIGALSCVEQMTADLVADYVAQAAQNDKIEEQNKTIEQQNEEIKAQNEQILENQKKMLELQEEKSEDVPIPYLPKN